MKTPRYAALTSVLLMALSAGAKANVTCVDVNGVTIDDARECVDNSYTDRSINLDNSYTDNSTNTDNSHTDNSTNEDNSITVGDVTGNIVFKSPKQQQQSN